MHTSILSNEEWRKAHAALGKKRCKESSQTPSREGPGLPVDRSQGRNAYLCTRNMSVPYCPPTADLSWGWTGTPKGGSYREKKLKWKVPYNSKSLLVSPGKSKLINDRVSATNPNKRWIPQILLYPLSPESPHRSLGLYWIQPQSKKHK